MIITRIVKMTFREDSRLSFEGIFHITRPGILQFEGCFSVELHRDTHNPSTYITISRWASSDALENYRSSEFFKTTWAKVKGMFIDKAAAWTLETIEDKSKNYL